MTKNRFDETLIILDRDGVINERVPGYVKTPEEWVPIAGSIEAMVDLYQHGYRLVIASNQSGIGRGVMGVEDLRKVHEKMESLLRENQTHIDGLFFCPHAPKDHCECRKPKPGMLNSIAQRMHRNLKGVVFVGDSITDVEAANAAGATPVIVRTGLGRKTEEEAPKNVPVYDDLAAVARDLLGNPI